MKLLITLVILALRTVDTINANTTASNNEVDICSSDPGALIKSCFDHGEFLKKYRRKMVANKKRKTRRPDYDVCSESAEFRECIQTKVHECPAIMDHIPVKWEKIYDLLDCACNGTQECRDALSCVEEEYNSHFLVYCEEQYNFNILQRTHDKCRFLRHSLQCKNNLMKSACGHKAADFSKQMDIHLSHKKCNFLEKFEIPVPFIYTSQCPRNLTDMVDECTIQHIQYNEGKNMAKFYTTNSLIAESKKRELKQSCRDYKEFKKCVRPIKEQCREGVHRIFEYNSLLRVYALKMDYICTEAKDDYIESLECFQGIIDNEKLKSCDHIWGDLGKVLNKLTAHIYYCDEGHKHGILLRDELNRLVTCYGGVFEKGCGLNASQSMQKLIHHAFTDPFYLRFDYKPDCDLHATTLAPPSTTLSSTSQVPKETSTGHHRHHHKNNTNQKPIDRSRENSAAIVIVVSNSVSDISARTNLCVCIMLIVNSIMISLR